MRRRIGVILLGLALAGGTLALAWRLRELVLLFVAAVVMGASLRPLVDAFSARGLPRWLALACTYLGVLCAAVSLFVVVGVALVDEVGRVADGLSSGYETLLERWRAGPPVRRSLAAALPTPRALQQALRAMPTGQIAEGAVVAGMAVLRVVVASIVVVVLSAYWIGHRRSFERLALSFVPARHRPLARRLVSTVEAATGRHVLAEALRSTLAVAGLALLYRALGVPYPTLPAVLVGVARLVPLGGPAVGCVAAFAAGYPAGTTCAVVAAVATPAFLACVERVLLPRLLPAREVDPLLTAVVAITTAVTFGPWALLATPVIAAGIGSCIEVLVRTRRLEGREQDSLAVIVRRRWALEVRLAAVSTRTPPHVRVLVRRLGALVDELETQAAASGMRADPLPRMRDRGRFSLPKAQSPSP